MSKTAKAFKMLYEKGRISIGAVRQAVLDGVLTAEEYEWVTGEPYN